MNNYWVTLIIVIGVVAVAISFVAIRAIIKDNHLSRFQKVVYVIFSFFAPIVGPYTVLHFISQYYSIRDLPSIIPWPFYKFLIDKPPVRNKNKAESWDIEDGY